MANSEKDIGRVGQEIYNLAEELFPVCRSITGNGVRRTLNVIKRLIPLAIKEVPTGTQVFDWIVPREWNISAAWIKDPAGRKIVDFANNNLHVVNYSIPVKRKISLAELKGYLHTLPDQPDLIPYRTSYYQDSWGFCLSHHQFQELKDGIYEIFIDSTLEDGHLTYGEFVIPGEKRQEFLISCHICHPSLANDNLSGVALAAFLADYLQKENHRYTYRFLFIPGTIGSITWLSQNENLVPQIKYGLVVACAGDPGKITYKKSRSGLAEIDMAVAYALKHSGQPYDIAEFSPYGYDERQYCSPGFNLPVGCFSRTPYSKYAEYHTSADNMDFIKPEFLADSFEKCLTVINLIEKNEKFLNTNPKCEPQLGSRGLYREMGGYKDSRSIEAAMLWVLNLSDGNHSLLDIAEKSGIYFTDIHEAAQVLYKQGLLTIYEEK